MIRLKRVYEKPSRADGVRVLVDRLWPRGLSKERAAVKLWLKDIAPSASCASGSAHDPVKWRQFQARYRKELREKQDLLQELTTLSKRQTVTLLYGATDKQHNEALVLTTILAGGTHGRRRCRALH